MKRFISRNIAPLCLLLSVTVLFAAFLIVRLHANAGTYVLVRRSGDAAQLNDLSIRLVMGDERHEQHITINGGALTHRFCAVPPYADTAVKTYMLDQDFTEDPNADVQVEVKTFTEVATDDQITLRDVMTRHADRARLSVVVHAESTMSVYRRVIVPTDLYVQDDAHPFESTLKRFRSRYRYIKPDGETGWNETGGYYQEPPEEELREENTSAYDVSDFRVPEALQAANVMLNNYATDSAGRLYFTPGVQPYMRGEWAVYRVEKWTKNENPIELASRDGYDYYVPTAAIPLGEVTKLASFPAQDTATLRLDIVEDRVCLLSIEGGMLTFRAYAMDGAQIAQTPLFAYDPDTTYITGLHSNRDGDSSMLCYALYTRDSTGYSTFNSLACVELTSSAAVLRSRIKPDFDAIDYAFFGGRWALLRMESAGRDGKQDSLYSPLRYTLELLDPDGASLYAGEIVTDAYEDQLQYYGRTVENTSGRELHFSPGRMLRFADDPISGR